MKNSKLTLTAAVVIIAAGVIFGLKTWKQSQGRPQGTVSSAKVKGNPQAPLRVTEYLDFQCPSCAQGAAILSHYVKQYPDGIYVELKHYPLAGHRHGMFGAKYAECAARQGKFWLFHDIILARQDQWAGLVDPTPAFKEYAKEAGLDAGKTESCLKDPAIEEYIKNDQAIGQSMGVRSTPTFFINNEMLVGTRQLTERLSSALAQP